MSDPLDLDDRETMELFAAGDTTGVFQFGSEGMRDWLRRFRPDRFVQLSALYAMYRPGAIERFGLYESLRNGTAADNTCEVPSRDLQGIVGETYGMLIYQEQLMEVVARVASFPLREQKLLCKFAGPWHPVTMVDGEPVDILGHLGKKFLEGGLAKGYGEDELLDFWNGFVCSKKGAYLFSRAHSVSYTLVAYRCAYMKAHDPALFYNTVYPSLRWEEDRKSLYEDACHHGMVFIPDTGQFYKVVDD